MTLPRSTASAQPPDLEESVLTAFPTPVANLLWPDSGPLNSLLRELVLAEERRGPGLARSNEGGWHSALDFLTREADCIRHLRRRIEQVVDGLTRRFARPTATDRPIRYHVEGWANVLRAGQYHSVHCHPNAFWSGVYYVTDIDSSPDHPASGKLELVDPRPVASASYAELTNLYGRLLLRPQAGQMIVFPSWLQHFVHPYFGPGERISVAFNASIVQQREP